MSESSSDLPLIQQDVVDPDALEIARADLVAAVHALFSSDVMSASGHGNLSVRIPGYPRYIVLSSGDLLSPPAAGERRIAQHSDRFVRGEIAIVDLEGKVVAGHLPALSTAIIPMHTEVYRTRPETNSVVHTHSPFATSFAVAGQPIPALYEALLVHGQHVDIPVAPWGPRGSRQAVDGITATLTEHPETNALVLANHGLLVTAESAARSAVLVVAVEEAAQAVLGARQLGGPAPYPEITGH